MYNNKSIFYYFNCILLNYVSTWQRYLVLLYIITTNRKSNFVLTTYYNWIFMRLILTYKLLLDIYIKKKISNTYHYFSHNNIFVGIWLKYWLHYILRKFSFFLRFNKNKYLQIVQMHNILFTMNISLLYINYRLSNIYIRYNL